MKAERAARGEVVVEAALAREARSGAPRIPLARVPALRRLAPGEPAALVDATGRPAGEGIADPSRGVFRLWGRGASGGFGEGFFRARLEEALARRARLHGDPETDAYRLLHGEGEGLSGFAVDAWAGFLTVQVLGSGPERWSSCLEKALAARLEPRGIVRKLVLPGGESPARPRSRRGGTPAALFLNRGPLERGPLERGKVEERVVHGQAPPETLVVRESGVPFLVRLRGARHAGLFTDMREERRRLASLAAGRRVLNLFSYTGGFSVAAARGGAEEVVSVDVVKKVLEWSKENFRLSGIDPGRHRFVRMDAREYLRLARKRGWTFGAIILDPPTFATAGAARWSLRREYPGLLREALAVLEGGGYLWAAANTAAVLPAELEGWIREASREAARPLRTVARGGELEDYPAPRGCFRHEHLKVVVLRG